MILYNSELELFQKPSKLLTDLRTFFVFFCSNKKYKEITLQKGPPARRYSLGGLPSGTSFLLHDRLMRSSDFDMVPGLVDFLEERKGEQKAKAYTFIYISCFILNQDMLEGAA